MKDRDEQLARGRVGDSAARGFMEARTLAMKRGGERRRRSELSENACIFEIRGSGLDVSVSRGGFVVRGMFGWEFSAEVVGTRDVSDFDGEIC